MSLSDFIVNPDNFTKEGQIGEGNFSQVFLVHPNKKKDKKLALKRIDTSLEKDDWQKAFIREITVMSDINYPSLIHLYGFSLPSQGGSFIEIYTEFLPNGTLLSALKKDELAADGSKILSPTTRSIIVYGIASGMKYLHDKCILHRDLKPENIFLDKKYFPIISDFGLSKFATNEMNMTTKLGTPYFMAPELLHDDEDTKITNKIDVYSFAITLLTFFTTSYKFRGAQPRSISQLINNITNNKRYIIPENTPKFYTKLINRCWANDPEDRPSFKEILDIFNKNDDFMFEGSDKKQVHAYMNSLKKADETKLNESVISSSSDDDNEEETKEFNFI